jgi:hypothetical protein
MFPKLLSEADKPCGRRPRESGFRARQGIILADHEINELAWASCHDVHRRVDGLCFGQQE